VRALGFAWLAFLLVGAASAALAQIGSLELDRVGELHVEIRDPLPDAIITGEGSWVAVRGGASIHGAVEQIDLFFVVDTSKSLRTTDPSDHRKAGVIRLVESFPAWSDVRIGVVGFDRKANLLSPLTADRSAAIAALGELGRLGTTNIAAGIREALEGFEGRGRPGAARVILLFTDGKSGEEKTRAAAREAQAQGVVIHPVILGTDEEGIGILKEIAAATGGEFVQVKNPILLPKAFRQLRATGVESVTVSVNGSSPRKASLSFGSFEARIPLREGDNHIAATALSIDGRSMTHEIQVTVRPPGCAELQVDAMSNGEPALSVSARAVEIVIDASGSMRGKLGDQSKMEIAQEITSDALDWLPSDLVLSLRAYGHRQEREAHDCSDTELLVSAGTGNREEIRRAIEELEPRGHTPLGYVLEQVARDQGSFAGERAVVLVTDGIESCGGDAPAAARALQSAGPVPVHVIGFGLGNAAAEDLASLRAIAGASGGVFITAGSPGQLREALRTSVGTSFQVWRADESEPVAQGSLGAGEVFPLPTGAYRLQLDSRPPQELAINLESGVRHEVVFVREGDEVSHAVGRGVADYALCETGARAPSGTPAAPR
jgi:Mg-chelatase subunit ChlD